MNSELKAMWDRIGTIKPEAAEAKPIGVGSLVLFNAPNPLGLAWLVVEIRPDCGMCWESDPPEPWVHCVPTDNFRLNGLADVAVREDGKEQLSIRCGRSMSFRLSALDPTRVIGTVSDAHMSRVNGKLRQIMNRMDGSSEQWENEADPDYHNWIDQISDAINQTKL